LGWFDNGAHRASKSVKGARALILAGAVLSLGSFAAVPAVAAATPIKVVIVVGPNGNSGVASNIADAKKLAAQARGFGATVIEIYSPNATWSKVVAAAQHANILIDMGHGNGWPSPYKPFQENTKDGMGLNASAGHGNTNVKYYGATFIKKSIHLAPGAVVILRGECYSAGNSEPGNPIPTIAQGEQRIDNFAAGFIKAGAKDVFAEPYGDVGYILNALFTSTQTAREIFMSGGGYGGYGSPSTTMKTYNSKSVRTPGARTVFQRDSTGHFRRSVNGAVDSNITDAP
jgi:hypothetical protein